MAASRNNPIPLKGGDEHDALTAAKSVHGFKPGERKKIKRGYWRRFRKTEKPEIKDQTE